MQALSDHHVYLEGSLLKPNMVTPGQVRLLLELQTKVREYITITEALTWMKALMTQVLEPPIRGLLRDCEIFANLWIAFVSSSTAKP